MKNILKKVFVNVSIKGENNILLDERSNLFVETGRGLIRDALSEDVTIDNTKYVVEFGSSTQTPLESDVDIITPISPVVYTNDYTISTVGTTEIDFSFTYENTSELALSFSELGLFYRPAGPDPGVGRADAGVLLARLKSTYTSITVGPTKTISIIWKIIF